MRSDREFWTTEDGSPTLRDPETGELYHNRAGAYSEAMVNYALPCCVDQLLSRRGSLTVLDACFGLGYNSLVLVKRCLQAGVSGELRIIAVDRDASMFAASGRVLETSHFQDIRHSVREDDFRYTFEQRDFRAEVRFMTGDLRAIVPALDESLGLIFHDPFSPKRVPELWTLDLFRRYAALLDTAGGAILTYSAAAAVRGAFLACGLSIFRTPSLGEKRGGTIACSFGFPMSDGHHLPLGEDEWGKVRSWSGIPYRDRNFSASRLEVVSRRQQLIELGRRLGAAPSELAGQWSD